MSNAISWSKCMWREYSEAGLGRCTRWGVCKVGIQNPNLQLEL